ncbi:MAG: FadR family transcriptional regulator [Spirochaetes bacterium]|nr:FadR family transcriptional regulator [Spirochaetota bacterium]
MRFKRIEKRSVTEEIIEYLKNEILNQTLKPGERLPSEENLAKQLGVGRGTVRETLRVLLYLGLIERRGKATYISFSANAQSIPSDFLQRVHKHEDVMKMIEVRKIIEPQAAELAAERGGQEKVDKIERCLQEMEKNLENIEDFIRCDNEFHLAVFEATENPILLEIIRSLQMIMRKNQAIILRNSETIKPRSFGYHKELCKAIKEGNDQKAREVMEQHLNDIEREMYLILRRGAVEAQ